MIDIKAIKAAAEAATKGEWSWQEGTPLVTKLWNGAEHSIAAVDWRTLAWHEDGNCAGRESGANAKHIATANPATVSAMCDEIERLQLKLEVSDKTGYDGIDCRDETIRLQDEEIDRLTIIASELQDLCDRQAKRLAEVETFNSRMGSVHWKI